MATQARKTGASVSTRQATTKTTTKVKEETPEERAIREDREHEIRMTRLRNEQEEREAAINEKVAIAEAASNDGPDPDSAALVTPTLRAQGIRPVAANQPKGVTCPECGKSLVIAPKSGTYYVVCSEAFRGDDSCWYYRELPAQTKSTGE